jgi:D-alanine-D-alanine ligase
MPSKLGRRKRLKIALLVDQSVPEAGKCGAFQLPSHSMECGIAEALRRRSYSVTVVPAVDDVTELLAQLRTCSPDVIFNVTEEHRSERRRDADLVGFLDVLGIPYTGSSSFALQLARDKAMSKLLVNHVGVQVPRFFIAQPRQRIGEIRLPFPLLVKKRFGDSSEGLTSRSLVRNRHALERELHRLLSSGEPAICEEFIPGRDLYVSILGNGRLRIFPPTWSKFGATTALSDHIATERVKSDKSYRRAQGITFLRARISASAFARLAADCRKIFRVLGLRDYARIDFRLTENGTVYFLEGNPNSDLGRGSFGTSARWGGLAYPELMETLVNFARRRGPNALPTPPHLSLI